MKHLTSRRICSDPQQMLVRLFNWMAGSFTQHALLILQSGSASSRLNVSSPPKGRGFHIRFSEKARAAKRTILTKRIVYLSENSRALSVKHWLSTRLSRSDPLLLHTFLLQHFYFYGIDVIGVHQWLFQATLRFAAGQHFQIHSEEHLERQDTALVGINLNTN